MLSAAFQLLRVLLTEQLTLLALLIRLLPVLAQVQCATPTDLMRSQYSIGHGFHSI